MVEVPATDFTIPEGFTLHTENSAHILLPSKNEAFLNPVQEFNRDLSVACIKVWSEEFNSAKEKRWRDKKDGNVKGKGRAGKKKLRTSGEASQPVVTHNPRKEETTATTKPAVDGTTELSSTVDSALTREPEFMPHKIVILEALSATGLRSIRYAKEIPLVKYVLANDLSPSAVEAIKRNVALNGLGPQDDAENTEGEDIVMGDSEPKPSTSSIPKKLAKVRINEGDACALMYSHRPERSRVDCVDLDPYGTAAPFIDAAVQCINDGGLLCVTCTDLSVLATNNYPEKCYSNYGGIPVKAEYCHEAALRLVLHTISTSASRYGRYIRPRLSLSIDFYVRLFITVHTAPIEVKRAASKTSTFYVCSNCQSHYEQPLGKVVERTSNKNGQVNVLFRQHAGPPVGDQCPECEATLHVAGPMWSAPIHDAGFVSKVLQHADDESEKYGTAVRMKGMLTVAKEELETPFYFTPGRLSGVFHCISPSLEDVASALLNAGHEVSRSHALAGSLKTTAPRQVVHDIFRGWIKNHPVRADRISDTSPARHLHAKDPKFEADFTLHPNCVTKSSKVKLVRYQQNPTPNWGPGTKADSKRKRDDAEDGQ